jgi:hypothetical protein
VEGGGALLLELPGSEELSAEPLELQSDDSVHYGRRYRAQVVQGVWGPDVRVITEGVFINDAETGRLVARMAWEEFTKRVLADEWRGASSYRDMLGQCSPERYFRLTGQPYVPRAAPGRAEEIPVEEAAPKEAGPFRRWLEKHKAQAVLIALFGSMLFGALLYGVGIAPFTGKRAPAIREKHDTATRLRRFEYVVRNLNRMALENPREAARAADDAAAFLRSIESESLTSDQRATIRRLQEKLEKFQEFSRTRRLPANAE